MAIFGVKQDKKSITLWTGDLKQSLPKIEEFTKIELPFQMDCFQAKLLNEQQDVILNCQTSQPMDVLCLISKDSIHCNQFLTFSKSHSKETRILKIKSSTFVLSLNKDMAPNNQQVQYIMIYKMTSNSFTFNNIIDANLIGGNKLELAGFEQLADGTLVLADKVSSQLVFIELTIDNKLKIKDSWAMPSLQTLSITAENTILVATEQQIRQYQTDKLLINKYQTEPVDFQSIMANPYSLIAFTDKTIYIYDRSSPSLKLLKTIMQVHQKMDLHLSPKANHLYQLLDYQVRLVQLSDYYVQVQGAFKSQLLNIKAQSGQIICNLEVQVIFVKDVEEAIIKTSIQQSAFAFDSLQGLHLKLENYFGGANLQYQVEQKQSNAQKNTHKRYITHNTDNTPPSHNTDFDIKLQQTQKFDFYPSFPTMENMTIVQVKDKGFFYIGLNTFKSAQIKIDWCTKSTDKIKCELRENKKLIYQQSLSILYITSAIRKNGQIMLAWTFKESLIVSGISLITFKEFLIFSGTSFNYNSIVIGQDRYYLVSKQTKSIYVSIDYSFGISLTCQSFNNQELEQLQQFYPRAVYLDRASNDVFYVKLPTKLAKMTISSGKVSLLWVKPILTQYIPDEKWSLTMLENTILGVFPEGIKEFKLISNDLIELQTLTTFKPLTTTVIHQKDSSIVVLTNASSPTTASASSQTATTLVYLRPNSGSIDLQYYQATATSSSIVTPNWVVDPLTHSLSYISDSPKLVVNSNLKDQVFKEDLIVNIGVKGSQGSSINTETQVEAVNYPVKIKDNSLPNNQLTFPHNSDFNVINLKINQYFNGSIDKVHIYCPYCSDQSIIILPPIRQVSQIQEIKQNVLDYVHFGDAYKIIALASNFLFIIDNKTKIIDYQMLTKQNCSNLAYQQKIGLLVYCQTSFTQQILLYKIVQNKFTFNMTFTIKTDRIIKNFDQMFGVTIDTRKLIFILDNDQYKDTNNKNSTIKVFQITNDSLSFVKQIDSKVFLFANLMPINDMQFIGNSVIVTIGDYGLGYATLTSQSQIFTNTHNINLKSEPTIKEISVQNSLFKQIEFIEKLQNGIKLLITTTTSSSMVIVLSNSQQQFSFKQITQSYYRYGSKKLLKWNAITKDSIFLSYYNSTTEMVTIVMYPRKQNSKNYFISGVSFKVQKKMIKYCPSSLGYNNQLLISSKQTLKSSNKISKLHVFNTTTVYSLVLNYSQPGKFSNITVKASNDYTSVEHILAIKFDQKETSSGLQWYTVVIVAAVVLILVGVSYGMYLYMKKKKNDHKVTLLTEEGEKEEDDQIV